jgi:hypothetical protein
VNRNRLKLIGLVWAFLLIAVIWVDRWIVTVAFSFVTCVLGIAVLIATSSSQAPDRKDVKGAGIVLIIGGALLTLIEIADALVTGRL